MRNHRKVKALRNKFGLEGYAIWCMFLETLTESDCFKIKLLGSVDYELLSADFGTSAEKLSDVLNYCLAIKLILWDKNNKEYYSDSLIERLSPLVEKREHYRVKYTKTIVSDAETPISDAEMPQTKLNKTKLNISKDMLSHKIPKIKKTIQELQDNGDIKTADNYQADGMSPRQVLLAKKAIERSLGLGRSTKWTQLLFGAGHDFAKIYKAKVGHPYIGGIILDEIAKRLAEYYEAGETRETVRHMLSDFFESQKAEDIGRTPNIAFSENTYNLWKDNKLKPKKEDKKVWQV